MLGIINKIDKLTELTNALPDNTYIFATVSIDKNKATFNVNVGYTDLHLSKLIDIFNNRPESKMIFSVRSSKEYYATGAYPTDHQVKELVKGIHKECRVFYQEPWPAEVPNFNLEDTIVLRFGYNEGCTFDKACAANTVFDMKCKNGSGVLLISKEGNIVLENRIPVLI